MEKKPRVAIYPGSFDPLTNGHMDIIERARHLFDKVIITILHNPNKKALFSVEERMEMIRESLPQDDVLKVDTFDGLLVDFARQQNAVAIIRGMRAISDFENEFQMALMNRRLNRDVQTIFLMTGLRWIFTSSSIIKEVAAFGGDISGMAPLPIKKKMKQKFQSASI